MDLESVLQSFVKDLSLMDDHVPRLIGLTWSYDQTAKLFYFRARCMHTRFFGQPEIALECATKTSVGAPRGDRRHESCAESRKNR